jgi:hypothetical protein
VTEQTSTRRLRVLKYRGTLHGTNEYPFLIGAHGVTVLPITSLGLQHTVSDKRVSSGMPSLDEMLGGTGFYRGSSVLISGTAGTGKSTLAAQFCAARAGGVSGRCTSPSRSRRRRSFATWHRSASTSRTGWTPGCCSSAASAPACWVSRHT